MNYIEEPYISDPQPDKMNLMKKVGVFSFVPIVCEMFCTVADLDIIFLRPEEPGSILTKGGDIDNHIKTLLDGLRMPKESEIPSGDCPQNGENPFFIFLRMTHWSHTYQLQQIGY